MTDLQSPTIKLSDSQQYQLIIKITDSPTEVWVEIKDPKALRLMDRSYVDIDEAITSVIKYLHSVKKRINLKLW
jgi:hypothetical protein